MFFMSEIENKLKDSITEVIKECFDYTPENGVVMLESPKDNTNGDYSTNIAMRLTKLLRQNPQLIAKTIVEALEKKLDCTEKIQIAGPGFINFYMKKAAMANIINTIIDAGDDYGSSNIGNGLKVNVEFISANPTGTLHVGHARGAAWGDSICRILEKAGYKVLREYYINDAGHQIDMLGESFYARYLEHFGKEFNLPDDGYHGHDVVELCEKLIEEIGDSYLNVDKDEAIEFFKKEGRRLFLERIDTDLKYFGVKFDSWISEKMFYSEHKVEQVLERMNQLGLTYEKDNALWFRSTNYGDDKDRVLRKSTGFYTYLTPDIANHMYKFERGYDKLVDLWGADHHGYIPRMKAAITAMGYDKDALEVDIIQMVRLVENGQEVKMSKRTGNAVTLRELIDEVGVDAARYNFVSKSVETHFDFDLGLAKSQSNDNPVFYAQYAYARICSILRQAPALVKKDSYDLLVDEKEVDLLKHISSFTAVVADAATNRAAHKLANFIQKTAQCFHSFYGVCKVNDPANPELSAQRVALLEATRITLKNALYLLGVSAPEKM